MTGIQVPLVEEDLVTWWLESGLKSTDRYGGLRPEMLLYAITAVLKVRLDVSVGQPNSCRISVAEESLRLLRTTLAAKFCRRSSLMDCARVHVFQTESA